MLNQSNAIVRQDRELSHGSMIGLTVLLGICTVLLSLTSRTVHATTSPTPRLVLQADSDWKFMLSDASGAESPSFEEAAWRTVNLPHDWSIEGPLGANNPTGAGGGFYPAGVVWYRKTFKAPAEWRNKRVSVEFDGVYRDSTVYLNGHKVGTHPYGYTSFAFTSDEAMKHTVSGTGQVEEDRDDEAGRDFICHDDGLCCG